VGPDRIHIVAGSLVVAGVAQAIWTVTMVFRTRPAVSAEDRLRAGTSGEASRSFRRVLWQSLPMILGLGVLQLNTFLDGLIAGWPAITGQDTIFGHPYPLGPKDLATLTYAQRLYEFPLGVFGIAVATAIFPQLSREVGDPDKFRATLRKGVRLAFFIGFPASIGIALLRDPIVAVVYQGFSFDVADVGRVSPVLLAYAVAIWSYSLNQVFTRAFYARREAMIAVWIAIGVVVLNIGLNLFLVFGTSLGVAGLAWSTAICAIVQSLALLVALRRPLGTLFSVEVRRSVLRTVVAAMAMAVVLSLALMAIPSATSWAGQLLRLVILIPVGGVVFVGLSALLGMHELRWAIGRATTPSTAEDNDPLDRPPGDT
ncbi:MAG: polysaccharide biosynthesis C-terminal domain-containing protein, partial [Phycisphaerales bacterium]|nr:polysaccharide biosynthesis C-terminal domain-containing protein [Phycisphaerales bacterium]